MMYSIMWLLCKIYSRLSWDGMGYKWWVLHT